MRAYIVSLGCPKNLCDTEAIMGELREKGYEISPSVKNSDIAVVNTCAFLKSAREESVTVIKSLVKKGLKVYMAGCLPKHPLYGKAGGIKSLPVQTLDSIRTYNCAEPKVKATPPWTAYVKISEGCNNNCTYCLIPKIRGKLIVRKMADILKEVTQLAKNGVKELIYVAQDTTAYPNFPLLLKKTAKIEEIHWIRIMYSNPQHVTKNLIKVMKEEPKIARYLDLPLQHICDRILGLMNRPQPNSDGIKNLIKTLRREVTGIRIRTSFIVGFPGETERESQALLDFIKETKFDRVGAFCFSREKGTSADTLRGQIPDKVKKIRFSRLMKEQNRISKELNKKLVGKIIEVLFEGNNRGRSMFDAPGIDCSVLFNAKGLQPGEFAKVKIIGAKAYDLTGQLVST